MVSFQGCKGILGADILQSDETLSDYEPCENHGNYLISLVWDLS